MGKPCSATPTSRPRARARRTAVVGALALPAAVLAVLQPGDAGAAQPRSLSSGTTHTVTVSSTSAAGLAAVRAAGGSQLASYRAFSVWTVPASKEAALDRLRGVDASPELQQIDLRGRTLDTSRAVPAPSSLAAQDSSGPQLRLLQFAAPVKPAWFASLQATGARVVGYVPNNAYLVWTSGTTRTALERLTATDPTVQYTGPFDPAYRLAPDLTGKQAPTSATVAVAVQVVDGAQGDADLATITSGRPVLRPAYTLGALRTATVRVPVDQLGSIASLPSVVDVERWVAPQMNDEVQDQLLAGNVQTVGGKTTATGPGYLAWLDAHGFPHDPAAYPKVVVVDDGIDEGDTTPLHPDFYLSGNPAGASRVTSNDNCTTDPTADGGAGHGNLNAGIVGGYNDGTTATDVDSSGYHYGLGVNPFGRLGGLKIFSNAGTYELVGCGGTIAGLVQRAYDDGAGLTTNSWGSSVNGAYTSDSQAFDAATRDASATTPGNQEMLHVVSAGNSGSAAQTIGSPASAKNVLTVGATENVRDQGTLDGCGVADGDSDSDIATFSSRGPTTDGRTKPDLVAAGTHVSGPASQDPSYDGTGVCGANNANNRYYPLGQTKYTWSSGTSHSTPAVAGAASLVQEYYGRAIAPGQTASPAMLKALLENTPRYLSGVGSGGNLPSNSQGYGVPDLGALFDPSAARWVSDQDHLFTATGQTYGRTFSVDDASKPLRVSLAWTDAPGTTVGAAYVNNLDLVVYAGGKTYRGNVFANGLSSPGGTADAKNNVEDVFLPAGTTGPVRVVVQATNIAGNGVPGNSSALDQDFALTVGNGDVSAAPQPVATAGGLTLVDSTGDGDTTYEPGETVGVLAAVTNNGDGASAAATGTLSVVSGPADIVQGSARYDAIAPGATSTGQRSYQVQVRDNAACQATVVLRHTWTADDGQVLTQETSFVTGTPGTPSSTYTSTASTDVPKAIPDNNPTGVTSTLPLTGSDTVGAVKVTINVTHTWDGDLTATLVSPAGTAVTLVARRGSSGDNFTQTVFDDAAAASIATGTAPFTGSFRPEQPLGVLKGQPAAGTWSLRLADSANGDTGSLVSWSLAVAPLQPPVCKAPATSVRLGAPDATRESAGSLDVPVTLVRPDGATHTATFTPSDGTATSPADYDASPITVTWNPGDPLTQHVLVPLVRDDVDEPTESFTVASTSSDVPVSGPVTASILDTPTARIGVGDTSAGEGSDLVFPVTLADRVAGATYSVVLTTSDGTAGAGDYTATTTTVTWAAGDPDTRQVHVPTTQDAIDEPDETVEVALSQPTSSDRVKLDDAGGEGTITDDDQVVANVGTPTPVDEAGGTSLAFPVTLSGANPADSYSVHVATSDGTATAGSDYTAVDRTLTWAPGANTSQTVLVPVLDDDVDEPNETVTLTLDTATGGSPDVGIGTASADGTILDDDATHVSVGDSPVVVEGGALSFPVTLTHAAPGATYTVRVTTGGGTASAGDYTAVDRTLTFAPGGPRTQQVVVATTQDALVERLETVQVSLTAPTGGNHPVVVDDATGVGTIADDDGLPIVTLKGAKTKEGTKGTHLLTFTATLDAAATKAVTFTWRTADQTATTPSDYKAAKGTLTIPAGANTATFSVPVVGDRKKEKSETFLVIGSKLVGGLWAGTSTATGTITNDDR